MKLIKDCIYIGLRTNQVKPMLEFWMNHIGGNYNKLLAMPIHQENPPNRFTYGKYDFESDSVD